VTQATTTAVSAIIPITGGADDIAATYREYKRGLDAAGRPYEVIYVVDGDHRHLVPTIKGLRDSGEPIKVITFPRAYGETAALTAGFEHAKGDILLTLPAYRHIDARAIPLLIEGLRDGDMVVARRSPRSDRRLVTWQSRLFHFLLRVLLNSPFQDLGPGARAFHRRIINDVRIYGDQHRFLPLIALNHGYSVREVEVPQPARKVSSWIPPLGTYSWLLLDVLSIYFLIKFTRKPLRFFGLIGGSIFLVGTVILVVLAIQRLFFGVALADRPILLLGSLLAVLGIQIIAVGLIGEIIIFAFAGEQKEYRIEQIIGEADEPPRPPAPMAAQPDSERERAPPLS
jgi:glycosyltransferase involved in cell wall biosynthesis